MGFLFIFILFISFDSKPQLWLTSGQSVGLALWSPNSHFGISVLLSHDLLSHPI